MDLARESDALREWKLRRASLRPVPAPSSSSAAAAMGDDDGRAAAPQEWIDRQQRLRQVDATRPPSLCHRMPLARAPLISTSPLLSLSPPPLGLSSSIVLLPRLRPTGAPPTVLRPASRDTHRRALLPPQDTVPPAGRAVPHRRRHLTAPVRAPGNRAQTQPTEG